MPTSEERRLKRAACLIASQLPEDQGEAVRVLHYARRIVEQLAEEKPPGEVIPLSSQAQRYLAVVREGEQEDQTDYPYIASPG